MDRTVVASASLASLSVVASLRLMSRVPAPVLAGALLTALAGALAAVAGVRRARRAAPADEGAPAAASAVAAPVGGAVPAPAAAGAAAAAPVAVARDGSDDGVRIELVDVDLGTGATSAAGPPGPPVADVGPATGGAPPTGHGSGGDDVDPAASQLASLVGRPDDAVVVLGADGRIRATSPACAELWGLPTDRWVGRSFAGTLVAADMAPFQRFLADLRAAPAGTVASLVARATHAGGAVRRLELRAVADGDGVVVTAREVGERRAAPAPAVDRDPLTGLATTDGLLERCAAALERLRTSTRPGVALLVLQIDDAAAIAAALGRLAADDLSLSVAERLQRCLRSGDVAARLDDGRFAVLIEGRAAAVVDTVAERLLELVHLPLRAGDVDVALAGAVGLAVGRPTSTSRSLLREASAAARSAHEVGGGRVHRFEPPD